MPSFLLALLFSFCFYKQSFFSFVQASSISGDVVPYTAPLERRGDLDSSTDTWLLQAPKGGEDSSPLFSAPIDQKNVAALTAPNTNSNNFISSPTNINNNDKLLLSEATTSEVGLLLASNTNCRSSLAADDDSTTLGSSQQQQQQQMAAGQQSPTEKRKRSIGGRRRRRRRWGDNSVVVPPPANACPAPVSLPLSPPPSTQNAQKNPSPQGIKKKKTKAPTKADDPPQPNGNTQQQQQSPSPSPPSSSADLDWDKDMYPSLFRIPIDGYTEGGYNPTCITKTDGLLPLGVCDSGDAEDVQGSARDFYGNPVDATVFLDAVAFKLEACRLGMCAKEKKRKKFLFVHIRTPPPHPAPGEKKFPKPKKKLILIFMILINPILAQAGRRETIPYFPPHRPSLFFLNFLYFFSPL